MTDSNDDAKTGPRRYRVPPAEFRFKKGTSGNLKGRPPKEQDPAAGPQALARRPPP